MYRTQCVLSLLLLYTGLVHTFDWDFVTRMYDRLQFYDKCGTLTHSQVIPPASNIKSFSYDPVHNRVLFADHHNIYSFDIASKTIETLVENTKNYVKSLAYDPVSELLFWSEKYTNMYSISLKPRFNNRVPEKQLILSEAVHDIAIDICGGFINWISNVTNIQRARFNGSQRETVADSASRNFVKIDQNAQKIYWYLSADISTDSWRTINCADLNGTNAREVHQKVRPRGYYERVRLAFSKNHIYWRICDKTNTRRNCSVWKIPKNAPSDVDVLVESNLLIESDQYIWGIAAKYNIEDVTRGVPNCARLKSLLPNNSDESLLCVHGTKVSGESRCECAQGYSGQRCEVSVCHNYCFKGVCTVTTEGKPKCKCNAEYSGARCEVNPCQAYCLNDGVCTLNENKEPVCHCTAGYTGSKCEVNVCQGYCQNGGVCTLNEDTEPMCQCTAGYSGTKCEVNMCHGYCQNCGVCTLNENREPVCQCTADYKGDRCDVAILHNKEI